MTITVYTKPNCVMCDSTFRALFSKGIDPEYVNLAANPQALEEVKALGYMQAPVVVTDDDHWSGFRPDKISEVVARLLEEGVELEDRSALVEDALKAHHEHKKAEAGLLTA